MESGDRNQEPRKENPKREEKKDSVRLLTLIQIVGCLAVLAAAVLLKTFGGTVYNTARDWYLEAVGDSIVTDDQVSNVKRVIVGLWPGSSKAPVSSAVSSEPSESSFGSAGGTASQAFSSAAGGESAVSSAANSAVSSGAVSK